MGLNNRVIRCFKQICIAAGRPKIRLLTMREWNKRFPRYKINQYTCGRCDMRGIIAVKYICIYDKNEIKDTIWHEILHILFPSKRHWWIECAAQKLAHNYRRGFFSKIYHKHMRNVPNIITLLRMVRKSTARFNRKH